MSEPIVAPAPRVGKRNTRGAGARPGKPCSGAACPLCRRWVEEAGRGARARRSAQATAEGLGEAGSAPARRGSKDLLAVWDHRRPPRSAKAK
jgi:hypothetical protein